MNFYISINSGHRPRCWSSQPGSTRLERIYRTNSTETRSSVLFCSALPRILGYLLNLIQQFNSLLGRGSRQQVYLLYAPSNSSYRVEFAYDSLCGSTVSSLYVLSLRLRKPSWVHEKNEIHSLVGGNRIQFVRDQLVLGWGVKLILIHMNI